MHDSCQSDSIRDITVLSLATTKRRGEEETSQYQLSLLPMNVRGEESIGMITRPCQVCWEMSGNNCVTNGKEG